MHGGRFEQVAADFVKVGNGPQDVHRDVALVVEGLDTAPDAQVSAFFWELLRGVRYGVGVDPLLDFD